VTAALHWSARYVGIPWQDLGRTANGCDCWGLTRLVYAEVPTEPVDLPAYDGDYATAEEMAEIAGLIHGAIDGGSWIRVGGLPRELDVLLFRRGRYDSHVGLVAGRGLMLHMVGEQASRIEPWTRPEWAFRLAGIFRHVSEPMPRPA
jgi:probable lipoprotein NlpC